MKNTLMGLIFLMGTMAQAQTQTPEESGWRNFFRVAGAVANVVNANLEKVRLYSHANMNIQEQWDLACDVTQTLNPSLLELNKLLTKHKVNDKLNCAPITPLIRLQTQIIAQCHDFYSKPVPDNAKVMLGKFALTVFQAKLVLTKCYPELAKVKLPMP